MAVARVTNRTRIFRHASAGGSVRKVTVEVDEDWWPKAECAKKKYRVKRKDGVPLYDWDGFYHQVNPQATENAKRVCFTECPVRQECLEHALQVEEPAGMWGGLIEEERFFLLGQRKTFNKRKPRA